MKTAFRPLSGDVTMSKNAVKQVLKRHGYDICIL